MQEFTWLSMKSQSSFILLLSIAVLYNAVLELNILPFLLSAYIVGREGTFYFPETIRTFRLKFLQRHLGSFSLWC